MILVVEYYLRNQVLLPSAELVRMKRLLRFVGLWMAGALAIAVPLSRLNVIHFHRLKGGVRTVGVVTRLEPENHQFVDYRFTVGSKEYSSSGLAGNGNPDFRSLVVGQSVIVYYLPENPQESCLGFPAEEEKNDVVSVGLAGLFFPLLFITWVSHRYPSFKRWLFS